MIIFNKTKKDEVTEERLEEFRASILAEIETARAETEENIIASIRDNLISAPEAGEEWNEYKSYIAGDTVLYEGVSYTAVKYSRGKSPADNPDRWTLTPTEAEIIAWADIEDGSVIEEGLVVTHNGKTWVCIAQHIKSSVYSPRSVSTKWKKVE